MIGPFPSNILRKRPVRAAALVLWGLTAAAASLAAAQNEAPKTPRTGQQIFLETCAACHGPDGKGRSRSRVGFDVPLPDLTDPDFASREPHYDWTGIARNGGPSKGFSEIMPSFRDALTIEELEAAVSYAKSLHGGETWPPGEFNLPRPLFTGKAYPEDEIVLQTTFSEDPDGLNSIGGKLVYEQRFGARNMWEVVIPFGWNERITDPLLPSPSWSAGLGDIAVAVKRDFYHNLKKGSILSGSAELFLPTGDRASGLGKGTFVFEPFLAYGQLLPADFFVQAQTGLEIPFKQGRGAERSLPPGRRRQGDPVQAVGPGLLPHGRDPGRQGARRRGEDPLRRRASDPGDAQQTASRQVQRRRAPAAQRNVGPESRGDGLPSLGLVRRRFLRRVVRT